MNLALLKKLVRILEKSGVDEIEVEEEGLRVRLAKNSRGAAGPAGSQHIPAQDFPVPHGGVAPAPAAPAAAVPAAPNVHEVRSPIVGTFYRAPAPDADPYIEVGETVQPKTVVCIIEAMKLMNEIETEVGGRVVKILVENGQPVEYNQVLFHIEPA
jgi:acetyl-CoA carboxylase biotin carboxyl carrier protein